MNKEVIEDLMKPRKKLMFNYPGNIYKVGDVFTLRGGWWFNEKHGQGLVDLDDCPELFRKLEWWEDRKPIELPKYVNWENDGVFEVEAWRTNHNTGQLDGVYTTWPNAFIFITDFTPATETEYINYIKEKK